MAAKEQGVKITGLGLSNQIVPEHPPPQAGGNGGKPVYRHFQRRGQHLRIHRLPQGDGEAEHIAPVLPQGGRVYFCGIVQPHPTKFSFFHSLFMKEGHGNGTGAGMGADDAANAGVAQFVGAVFPQRPAVLHIF